MKQFYLICLTFLAVFACSYQNPNTFHYISAPHYEKQAKLEIPVYIDRDFSKEDDIELHKAIEQWNYVLNGYVKLNIITDSFGMEDDISKKALNGQAWLILMIDSHSPLFEDKNTEELTFGFTNKIGGSLLYIVRDRLSQDDVLSVSLHEIGHLLGAEHGTGLMSPNYNKFKCVDMNSAFSVANYQLIPFDRINYCL